MFTNLHIPAAYKPILNHIKRKCKYHGITIRMVNERVVINNPDDPEDYDGGSFNPETNMLSVATGHQFEFWFCTFIHEFCHLEQWLEWDAKRWDKFLFATGEYYDVIQHNKPRDVSFMKAKHILMAGEWDCEKRMIKMVQRFKLPLLISDLKKKTNTYLYSLAYVATQKTFVIGLATQDDIWTRASDKFPRSVKEYDNIPDLIKFQFDTWSPLLTKYQKIRETYEDKRSKKVVLQRKNNR